MSGNARQEEAPPRQASGILALRSRAHALVRLLVLAGPLLASGCTSPGTIHRLHSELESIRREVVAPPAEPGLVQLRTAVHVHSKFSHDCDGEIDEIAEAARDAGVKVVFLTDHTNPEIFEHGPEGWVDGVYFVRGEEISIHGSVLALGTRASIRPCGKTMQQVIDEVVAKGGVAAIGHLEQTNPRGVSGYSAVSIHNLHADVLRIPRLRFPRLLLDALLYGRDRWNEILLHDLVRCSGPELRTWDELLLKGRVAAIGEVDAHQNVEVLGIELDPYRRTLGVLHTYLFVPEDWTREDLLEALARGRSYVAFSLIADPTGFSFEGTGADGHLIRAGDDVPYGAGLMLRVAAPAPGEIVVLRNGKELARKRGRALSLACDSPGVYRAEVRVELDGRVYPWIVSNPIYVGPAAENQPPETRPIQVPVAGATQAGERSTRAQQ